MIRAYGRGRRGPCGTCYGPGSDVAPDVSGEKLPPGAYLWCRHCGWTWAPRLKDRKPTKCPACYRHLHLHPALSFVIPTGGDGKRTELVSSVGIAASSIHPPVADLKNIDDFLAESSEPDSARQQDGIQGSAAPAAVAPVVTPRARYSCPICRRTVLLNLDDGGYRCPTCQVEWGADFKRRARRDSH